MFLSVGKMRNFVLVGVILQLAVIEINGNYSFGDIISFERTCPCISFTYRHFAIYVGQRKIDGKDLKEGIFHRTGLAISLCPLKLTDCIFGELKNEQSPFTRNIKKDNYLDNIRDFQKGTDKDIMKRIMEMKGNCGTYGPSNNCEHLATYVRYGKKISLQTDMSTEKLCKNTPSICNILEEIKKEIKCGDACSSKDG